MDSVKPQSGPEAHTVPEDVEDAVQHIKKGALHEIRKRRMLRQYRNATLVTVLLLALEVGGAVYFLVPLAQPIQEISNVESFFENVTVQNFHLGILAEFSTNLTYFVPQSTIDEKLAVAPWGPPPFNSTYSFFVNITGAHVANGNGTYYVFRPQSCPVTPNNYSEKKPEPWTYVPLYGECLLDFDYQGNFPLEVGVLLTTYNGTRSIAAWLGPVQTAGFLSVSPMDTEVNFINAMANQRLAQAAISIALLSILLQGVGIGIQLVEGPRRFEQQLTDERDKEMIDRAVDRLVQERLRGKEGGPPPPQEGPDEENSKK